MSACRIVASLVAVMIVLGGCAANRPGGGGPVAIHQPAAWAMVAEAPTSRDEARPVDAARHGGEAAAPAPRALAAMLLLAGPRVNAEWPPAAARPSAARIMSSCASAAEADGEPVGLPRKRRYVYRLGAGDALGEAVFSHYAAWIHARDGHERRLAGAAGDSP